MLQRLSTYQRSTRAESLAILFGQLGHWWLREFLNCFPHERPNG